MYGLDLFLNILKEYFPATLGAVIGAWKKKQSYPIPAFLEANIVDKFLTICIALVAIIVGISLGKWVSVALVGYYNLPAHAIPIVEFITALNGIKIVDSCIKGVEKSLDIVEEKIPKLVGSLLDSISNKIKDFFK